MSDRDKQLVKYGRDQAVLLGYFLDDWTDEEVLNLVKKNWGMK